MNSEPCFPELVPRIHEALTRALAAGILEEEMTEVVADYLVTGTAPRSKCGHIGEQDPPRFACDILFYQMGCFKPAYDDSVAARYLIEAIELLEASSTAVLPMLPQNAAARFPAYANLFLF